MANHGYWGGGTWWATSWWPGRWWYKGPDGLYRSFMDERDRLHLKQGVEARITEIGGAEGIAAKDGRVTDEQEDPLRQGTWTVHPTVEASQAIYSGGLMPVIGYDTFTDTDGVLLNAHTADLGAGYGGSPTLFSINTNRCISSSGSSAVARKEDTIGDDDMDVEADVSTASVGSLRSGVAARVHATNINNYYAAYARYTDASGVDYYLMKRVAGVETQIGFYDANHAVASVHNLKLVIRAGSQKVFIDGIERISATEPDATLQGLTRAGIYMIGNNNLSVTVDNFYSYAVAAPAAEFTFKPSLRVRRR